MTERLPFGNIIIKQDQHRGQSARRAGHFIQKDYPEVCLYQPYKARRNHPLTEEQKAYNRLLARYRIVVEHTIAQLNRFQVLVQVFRHARNSHSRVLRVVAGLVNRGIQTTPLKVYAHA